MADKVKGSENFNGLCSSDLPSSAAGGDRSGFGGGFNDKETQECLLAIPPEQHVFGIDCIREKILNYLIYDNKPKITGKLIKNTRLVQKCWLSTTTKLLKNCKNLQLIELAPAADGKDTGKLLNQFNGMFGAATRLQESFLPFKLKLDSNFFRDENYQSLSDCFTRSGNELAELEVIYPLDGGTMSVNFPPFHFPILRKVSFQFSDKVYTPIGEEKQEDPSNFADNKFGLWFLQSILNATEDLQELVIPFTNKDVVPVTFEFLRLPITIVSLELEIKLQSKTLETFFQRNQLPNLRDMTLQLHEKPLEKGLIYKILEQFRETLVNLHVGGLSCKGRRYPRTYLRYPVMSNLEYIYIYSTECELDAAEPEQLTCLQECLPKLDTLNLEYQTEAMLRKWVAKSKFEGVNKLMVSIINEFAAEMQDNYYRSPSWEIMTQLSVSFPNVKVLTLSLNIGFLNGLGVLFADMKKVQSLNIRLHGRVQRDSSDLVDATLTGLSERTVGALKEDNYVDVMESVLVLTNGSQSSIRNLSELTTLTLWTKNESGEASSSLASDFLFGQAFLRMPKLCNLYLHGKFEPSLRMQKEWKEHGRFIRYCA